MKAYVPNAPFTTPLYLLKPTIVEVKGSRKKVYPEISDENVIYASFKSYGGTETESNGVLTVEDTANIETWYRPNIDSDCRVVIGNDITAVYEIIGAPENIDMRNQYMKFKVKRVRGGV